MPGPPDRGLSRRLSRALGGSAALHVVGFGVWALVYDPSVATPEPTKRRAVKAVALTRAPEPAPVRKPEPKPEPEPEVEPEVEPEPVEPAESTASERPRGPPPPPAECINCAMMPAALGVPKKSSDRAGKAIPWGVPGGVPGGVVGGVPGGVVGGVLGGDPAAIGLGASLVPAQRAEPPKPLEAVMQRAIFTPDPDPERLAKTKTGMFDRHGGVSRVAFCIDTRGKTTSVRVVGRFPRDPGVDAICKAAVKRWRFRPFLVAGRPKRVCSVAVFEIEFE